MNAAARASPFGTRHSYTSLETPHMNLSLDETFLAPMLRVESQPRLPLSHIAIESKLYETPLGGAFLGMHLGLNIPVVVRVLRPSVKSVLKDFSKFV
jgi:hypothetical protein